MNRNMRKFLRKKGYEDSEIDAFLEISKFLKCRCKRKID